MIPRDIHSAFHSCFSSGVTTIDSHTAGEYTRLILDGSGDIPGRSMAEKRQYFIDNLDHQRLILTCEPRGNRDVVAAVVTEPVTPGASFGLIYMDACRYPYLCGHATIGAVTTLLQTGIVKAEPDDAGNASVIVDTPSGPMPTRARIGKGRILSVSFTSVPCFVYARDVPVELPATGTILIDVVCAGGFFAMADLDQPPLNSMQLTNDQIVSLGMSITRQSCVDLNVCHPLRPEVSTIDVTEFYRHSSPEHGTGFVVYGESHLDRSPCGTGTSARMALLFHKGLITAQTVYTSKGPLDTSFRAQVVRETRVGPFSAVEVEITGSAYITGLHQFVLDQHDPFPQGFLLS